MSVIEKQITKEEFLSLCEKHAGPNTVAYWTDFLSRNFLNVNKDDWRFVVVGENI